MSTSFLAVRALVETALRRSLGTIAPAPAILRRAIRHSVFSGGKRVRPLLTVLSAAACGGRPVSALAPACAIEYLHTYTLIHDDLPCMDDDDFRRGKPTCHKKFGAALAVLAGDALLTFAFDVLARSRCARRVDMIATLARCAGATGVIAGQVADVRQGARASAKEAWAINRLKTAELIVASTRLGALAADADTRTVALMTRFGYAVGMAFQLVDDALDKQGYARCCGEHQARARAQELTEGAKRMLLKRFGGRAEALIDFTAQIVQRTR